MKGLQIDGRRKKPTVHSRQNQGKILMARSIHYYFWAIVYSQWPTQLQGPNSQNKVQMSKTHRSKDIHSYIQVEDHNNSF